MKLCKKALTCTFTIQIKMLFEAKQDAIQIDTTQ